MYQAEVNENGISILHNSNRMMEGLRPEISFYGEPPISIKLMDQHSAAGNDESGSYRTYSYNYGDQEQTAKLTLEIKCYESIFMVSVDVQCKSEIFHRTRYLDAVGGVKLSVDGLGPIQGLMANYLFKEWWTRPYFGDSAGGIPSRTQSLVWSDGQCYHQILPVCGDVYKAELKGNGKGLDILVSSFDGGYIQCHTTAFIAGSGTNPFSTCSEIVQTGFKHLDISGVPRSKKKYPEALEYLGWCSWDAFYHEVNAEGVLAKAAELKEKAVSFKWMMIDDGWSEVKGQSLWSFQENKDKFPEGLKGLIEKLKSDYGFEWIGAWQAFTGYWDGIHEESQIIREMKEYLLKVNNGKYIPYPDAAKGFGFWNKWHKYLRNQGVDFIKVDNQSFLIDFVINNMSIAKAARGAQEALEASVAINFNNCMLNCAGMATENLWNRASTSVARNSDDFFPRVEQSFKEHALQNAYNSFYHSNFMWGDWDMWHTQHEHSLQSALLRAVSGGPIYVSDGIGKTDPDLLWPLITNSGRILRCDQPGLPTLDCLLHNPNTEGIPLKIWNKSGSAGILAAFNIDLEGKMVKGKMSPSDIPEIEGSHFAVYEYFTKTLTVMKKDERMELTLDKDGATLYIVVPFEGSCAYIGNANKFISPAVIEEKMEGETKDILTLKDGGYFAFVSNKQPAEITVNGCKKDAVNVNGVYGVDCSEFDGRVFMTIEWDR